MQKRVYTEQDLSVLESPLEVIRSRPDIYLPFRQVNEENLSVRLVDDVVYLSKGAVAILRWRGWWVVACEEDWVEVSRARWAERRRAATLPQIDDGLRGYFANIVPFPERGANDLHGEVLLTAFANEVFTATAEGSRVCLLGEVPDEGLLECIERSLPRWQRLVAFRMDG